MYPGLERVSRDPVADATVLIVEDERHLADLYAEYLEDAYAVETAYGGEEGLDRLHRGVDVVVVDRNLPMTPGDEVVAAVRNAAVDCRVLLVVESDPDGDETTADAEEVLVKPLSEEAIRDAVDRQVAVAEYAAVQEALSSARLRRNVMAVEQADEDDAEGADGAGDAAAETGDGADGEAESLAELDEEIAALEAELDAIAERPEVDESDLPS